MRTDASWQVGYNATNRRARMDVGTHATVAAGSCMHTALLSDSHKPKALSERYRRYDGCRRSAAPMWPDEELGKVDTTSCSCTSCSYSR